MKRRNLPQGFAFVLATAALFAISACSERSISAPSQINADPDAASADLVTPMECSVQVAKSSVSCKNPSALPAGANGDYIGGQNQYVKLTSSNVVNDTGAETFSFDVTVQNLMNEAIGTPDGVVPDANGIQVFFNTGPTTTSGTGVITVANADGTGTFMSANQPYFQYNEILAKDAVSNPKTWILNMPNTVSSFTFTVFLSTSIQPLLVINEMLVNPANFNANPDAVGEWIEIYNAGTRSVNMQNLVIADSAASGRRPYHLINTSLVIPSGGYLVLGNNSNTATNGGVPVDYSYGAAMAFANSLDAFKIARVWGTDTLTIDRTQYSNAAVSAVDGVSRELKNPLLDNSNMDGSNWAAASVTAVYGAGGRGTPKAQNSSYTP